MRNILSNNIIKVILLSAVILIFAVAGLSIGFFSPTSRAQIADTADDHSHESKKYICPMMCVDPQPQPGRCPVCSMDLVPMPDSMSTDINEPVVSLSPSAQKLSQVETETVKYGYAQLPIRLSGKVGFDETREKVISAWVPGRLEKVFVDNSGTYVKKGEPLVEIYSKKLNGEKAIYLSTLNDTIRSGENKKRRRDLNRARLRLLGLTDKQIEAIEKRPKIDFTEEILSPVSGTVIDKYIKEGMYVAEGQKLYTIADLSRVWVWLEAYEIDIPFIRYGQKVQITALALGQKKFKGMVSFIDPVLNNLTRTARVRVQVDNKENLLKPNMIVRAVIKAKVGRNGAVVASDKLKNKWVCPRHPENISDTAGVCPQSGLKLVRPHTLGYTGGDKPKPAVLAPVSAILFTGKRGLAYKAEQSNKFRGVEVELGPRAGDYYIINSGLKKGDRIAVNGAFRIDSALQLSGRPSMMRINNNALAKEVLPEGIRGDNSATKLSIALKRIVRHYFNLQRALGSDNVDASLSAAIKIEHATKKIPVNEIAGTEKEKIINDKKELIELTRMIGETRDIELMRKYFEPLSKIIETAVRKYGPFEGLDIYYVFCPMAFKDKGAYWLQENKLVHNPYEGKRMRKCGFVREQLSGKALAGK